MSMLISAYSRHGAKVILDLPKVTPEFRVKVAQWAITQNASLTEVAAEFGYLGTAQILTWKKIYRQKGPNGLLSITKGRKPIMTKNDRRKKATKRSKKPLITEQNRIEKLETENLELKIKLEVSKLLAYSVTAGSPNLGFALEPLNEFTSEVTGSIVQTIFAYRSGLAIPSQGMEKNVAKLI